MSDSESPERHNSHNLQNAFNNVNVGGDFKADSINIALSNSSTEDRIKLPPNFWQEKCKAMLDNQRRVTSNFLLHDNEDSQFNREQIYVPLALVERRKPDKKESEHSPEAGSKLYEPQYEEKQRFEHQAFLQQILEKGKSKTNGKRIALIGEPGAGKTTTLQDIAFWVLERELGLPIWISLADLEHNENLQTYLLKNWLNLAVSPSQKESAKQELETQIQQGRVWLLLDGVDEVAASGSQILQHLYKQLTGWLGNSRVVLTCRLNVWQADLNFLSDFETYRLLDFDYPQQVHQFIHNWFGSKDVSKGERLKTELENPDKARLRDLIQNPLRLTLLCSSWQSNEANLPDIKAELYAQFVQQFYNWKKNCFPVNDRQKQELNQALGRLALKDIDGSSSRFRLRESFISEELGYLDEENSLFYLALKLGWLNFVGIAAESSTKEKVYAFFHPTFEEYFAACAIDDWDFFLPRDHVNKPVEGKRYRVFEPQWKEVILLWLGRDKEDIAEEEKEKFINTLVDFEDGCSRNMFLPIPLLLLKRFLTSLRYFSLRKIKHRPQNDIKEFIRITTRKFYQYRGYLLAAAGINEFKEYPRAKEIVEQVVDWACVYDELILGIQDLAKTALTETDRTEAIAVLTNFIYSSRDFHFLRWSHNDSLRQALNILEKIGVRNKKAITALVQLIASARDEDTRWEAAESLGKIDPGNEKVKEIAALVQLINSNTDGEFSSKAVERLGKIDPGNEKVKEIAALVQSIAITKDKTTCYYAAERLGKIDPGNEKAIAALIKLINSTADKSLGNLAVYKLYKLEKILTKPLMQKVIKTLKNTTTEAAIQVLWHYSQNLSYPEFYSAWHS